MEHSELCPMCGSLQEMDVTAYHTVGVDAQGGSHTTITVAYHCKSCGALAHYERHEEQSVETQRVSYERAREA